ncbi:MAG: hypothetical protein AB7L65_07680, partial [Hyphomonadaceae bacterium]
MTRRRHLRHAAAAAAGAAALAGGGALAFGPLAPWLVQHIGDGQKIWRLGHLSLSGVRGAHLGALHVDHLALADGQGVWAEAEDVSLRWRPFDILRGSVRLDEIEAARLHILRKPALSSPSKSGGPDFDVDLTALHVRRIELDAPAAGVAAIMRLDLGLFVKDDALKRLDLALLRLDAPSDRANIQYRDEHGMRLAAEIVGAREGVFAHLLGNENEALRIDASGQGAAAAGEASLTGRIAERPLIEAALSWRGADWRLRAGAHLAATPVLADLHARFGDALSIEAAGVRNGAFTAHFAAPNLTGALSAEKTDGLALIGPARIVADTRDLHRAAPEILVTAGPAHLEGGLTSQGGRTELNVALTAQDVQTAGQTVSLQGPARVRFSKAGVEGRADLAVTTHRSPLLDGARLTLALSYDRSRSRFA